MKYIFATILFLTILTDSKPIKSNSIEIKQIYYTDIEVLISESDIRFNQYKVRVFNDSMMKIKCEQLACIEKSYYRKLKNKKIDIRSFMSLERTTKRNKN